MASTTAVKERPILMSGPMSCATLDDLKRQTRRIVKFKGSPWLMPLAHVDYARDGMPIWSDSPLPQSVKDSDYFDRGMPCPYGKVGDRLWVREAFALVNPLAGCELNRRPEHDGVRYRATWTKSHHSGWKPSIHMPRWASRLLLEIKEVRVERLNDISAHDALAEGIREFTKDDRLFKYWPCDPCEGPLRCRWSELPRTPVEAFRVLWESINGEGSWDANPWVWAITFKRLEPTQ